MMDDADTAQMVRDALAFTGGVDDAYLEVRYVDGVVILSGFAFGDAQRREAAEIASKIPSVNRVVNEITVVKKRV